LSVEKVKNLCDRYIEAVSNVKETRPTAQGKSRERWISISDLHGPMMRLDLVKEIIKRHSGAEGIVLNGDIFDCDLISTFPKSKEIPFAVEYAIVFQLVKHLSTHFGKVILVDGNHDKGRFARELGKLNPTIKFLIKDSPLRSVAEGRNYSSEGKDLGTINLPNVIYAGEDGPSWWTRVGKVIFAHRLRGYRKGPLANAVIVANWFINRGTQFQCLVSAHSHRVGMAPHIGGRVLIDQGALCHPMAYELDGRCAGTPIDLGYAIVDLDRHGNIDPVTTGPVYLGTYQEDQ